MEQVRFTKEDAEVALQRANEIFGNLSPAWVRKLSTYFDTVALFIALARLNAPTKAVADSDAAERAAQDKQWGGPEKDDRNTEAAWFQYINLQLHRCGHFADCDDPESPPLKETGDAARRRLVKIRALCTAALESMDRKAANVKGGS